MLPSRYSAIPAAPVSSTSRIPPASTFFRCSFSSRKTAPGIRKRTSTQAMKKGIATGSMYFIPRNTAMAIPVSFMASLYGLCILIPHLFRFRSVYQKRRFSFSLVCTVFFLFIPARQVLSFIPAGNEPCVVIVAEAFISRPLPALFLLRCAERRPLCTRAPRTLPPPSAPDARSPLHSSRPPALSYRYHCSCLQKPSSPPS